MSLVLGISAYYHDSAATLIDDNKILSAIQEERFSRIKNDQNFPILAIKNILKQNNISLRDISSIVFYEKPLIKFERIIETSLLNVPKGFRQFKASMPIWIKDKLFLKRKIFKELHSIDKDFDISKIKFSSHHLSHAASAFFPSPFKKASIITIDGVGEWSTTTVAEGNENHIKILKEIRYPHSLGLLYSSFTYFLGFKVNSGEYKLMGLSPYGEPTFRDKIMNNLINIYDDGSFKINQKYFSYSTSDIMINKNFCDLFGIKPKLPEENFTKIHLDIASSIQSVLNEAIMNLVKSVKNELQSDYLCLSGGVALNCVSNYHIQKSNLFKKIWIQPAAGDAGGALGAAYAYKFHFENKKRNVDKKDSMNRALLGPSYTDDEILKVIRKFKLKYERYETDDLITKVAKILESQKYLGFFQGRMEYGPRSLGSRSILADPRGKDVQKMLNLKIKFRESFRPFAPAILSDLSEKYFDNQQESPYMLSTYELKNNNKKKVDIDKNLDIKSQLKNIKSEFPAITHVDFSSRVQTVDKHSNELFYKLLLKFYEITGCPILLNTSFNVRGEPIVCSPKDAINCFISTNLDYLVIGKYIIKRDEKFPEVKFLKNNYLD